jgi:hypothetical protein
MRPRAFSCNAEMLFSVGSPIFPDILITGLNFYLIYFDILS